MKLVVAQVAYRVRRPIRTAQGTMELRSGFRVGLEVDGVLGRGETMPMPSFGTETYAACQAALAGFELQGLPGSLDEVAAATLPLLATPAARFGVECALLEHLARRRGLPVAALLAGSGPVRQELLVNALLEGDDAAGLAEAARQAVAQGFSVVKVKVAARPLSVDAQRLLAVRRAVGPGVKIRIDANGGWTEATARSALRGLEALGLEVCEQPVSPGDVEGLRRLRRHVPCRIAADETMLVTDVLDRLLMRDPDAAADVLVLKPAALGGLLPSLQLARRAATAGTDSYVTTLMDGPLSRAAAVHLAAVLPGEAWAHGLSTVELLDGVPDDALTPRGGRIHLSQVPGWGVS
jgi:o-succinylbenzoate synthase